MLQLDIGNTFFGKVSLCLFVSHFKYTSWPVPLCSFLICSVFEFEMAVWSAILTLTHLKQNNLFIVVWWIKLKCCSNFYTIQWDFHLANSRKRRVGCWTLAQDVWIQGSWQVSLQPVIILARFLIGTVNPSPLSKNFRYKK